MPEDRQRSHGRASASLEFGCQMSLVALVVVACVAGIPPIIDAIVQSSFAQPKASAALACRVCGTVEAVREVKLGAVKYGVSPASAEGFVMLIGLLSGKLNPNAVKIYEVEVLLQDGSVRVIREGTPPAWKPGDQVRIVTGRIEQLS